jgi:DNA-binding transcriptional ArsR family regulator
MDEAGVSAVKALTHPLRLELLDLLRFEGPSTATQLGKRVGESSGSTSYHLRQLARHGFIEEDAPRGGRERWWRYRERTVHVESDDQTSRTFLAELLSREAHAVERFLSRREPLPLEWEDASFFQSRALRLTADELEQLHARFEELIATLRRADDSDAPATARPVRLLTIAYPATLD